MKHFTATTTVAAALLLAGCGGHDNVGNTAASNETVVSDDSGNGTDAFANDLAAAPLANAGSLDTNTAETPAAANIQ